MGPDELESIYEEVDELSWDSAAAVALLERAIAIVDVRMDLDAGWKLRLDITDRIYATGDWDKLFVYFGWCLARSDAEPERFPIHRLLWKYKWILNEGVRMPNIARADLEGLMEDMQRRYAAAGSTLRPVHEHRAVVRALLGDLDAVPEALAAWDAVARDHLSDCRACEPSLRAEVLEAIGEHAQAEAVLLAQVRAESSCSEEPHRTHARLAWLLARRGDLEGARRHHHLGYRMVRNVDKLVQAHAHHIGALALAHEDEAVVPLIERHLPGALEHVSPWERLIFLRASALALDGLVARGRATPRFRVPASTGLEHPDVEELGAWTWQALRELVGAFDRRNGNTFATKLVGDWAP